MAIKIKKVRSLLNSFKFAIRGIIYCLKNERNMRIHCVVGFYILLFLPFFVLTRGEKALILFIIASVPAGEIVNTSIEILVDRLLPCYDQLARIAKDTAAGAVFVYAFFAAIIGFLLLWQPKAFQAIITFFLEHIFLFLLFLISLIIAIHFIFSGFSITKKIFVKYQAKRKIKK